MMKTLLGSALVAAVLTVPGMAADAPLSRQAYFGDLHVHTQYSFDAYIFNVRATPEDAYRFASGEPIEHALGFPLRLRGAPLDFMAVTDHATYLGVLSAMGDPDHALSRTEIAKQLISRDPAVYLPAFRGVAASIITGKSDPALQHEDVMRDTWQKVKDAADAHYAPGRFTTFVGYEYTSNQPYNLHRNVIFRGEGAPGRPFAATDSVDPEDLWRWMDGLRASGVESLAIPHNSNWSNGIMFQRTAFDGRPIDAQYAALRARNEPIVEISQVKGTSETHPLLSPNDEWADFELFGDKPAVYAALQGETDPKINVRGGYVRDALLTGLELEQTQGFNPYRLGFIGSSDTHNGGATYDEDVYVSKTGVNDGSPERRGSVPAEGVKDWATFAEMAANEKPAPYLTEWGASGLAGVWAEQNSRESIYDALRRKEVFATSGPRIRVRFFGGFDLLESDGIADLYAHGVPMGGDLLGRGSAAPVFFAEALRDPNGAWLDRLQIIKGWIENGNPREVVFDVACSDGVAPTADHRCPDNGAGVDLATCESAYDKGDVALATFWRDPEFDAKQRAFYYVRVIENPTCRWSTWDALRAGIAPRPGLPKTIAERAWSSPIWYTPN